MNVEGNICQVIALNNFFISVGLFVYLVLCRNCIKVKLTSGSFNISAAAFLTQSVCLDDTTVKFEIWDTAGQERYHSLAPMYYRGAQAAIVVYDITNQVRTSCRGFSRVTTIV